MFGRSKRVTFEAICAGGEEDMLTKLLEEAARSANYSIRRTEVVDLDAVAA